jgi:hypothetical protein
MMPPFAGMEQPPVRLSLQIPKRDTVVVRCGPMPPALRLPSVNRARWRIGAASALTLVCLALFVFSVAWNVRIGEHASDTGTNGGNNAAWIWFFGSLASLIASLTVLLLAIDGRNAMG